MNRQPLALLAAALLTATALLAPAPADAQQRNQVPEPPPMFVERVDVNVVNVEVFVTDRDGHRVAGLTRDDFELYEDGQPVEISNFYTVEWQDALMPGPPAAPGEAAVPAPRREPPPDQRLNLVVYVDHANIYPDDRRRILEELEGFLEDRLIEGDNVMLVNYHRTLEVVEPFTRDHARIVEALGEMGKAAAYGPIVDAEYRRLMSSMQVFIATQDEQGIRNAYQMVRSHVQQLQSDLRREAEALEKMVRALAGLPGRKALLFVSGGLPQRPGEELYQYLQDLAQTVNLTGIGAPLGGDFDAVIEPIREDQSHLFSAITRAANAHQVTLYTLDANGSGGRSSISAANSAESVGVGTAGGTTLDAMRTQNLQEPMIDLAEATGGASILNTSNFDDALTRMATDFDTYYSLGYNSPGAGDGEFHRIEVRVKRPGLKVRHRTGYVDKPRAERVADRTYSALLLDVESNPLGIEVDFGAPEHQGGKRWLLPVMVRIPFKEITLLPNGEVEEGRLNIYLAVRDEEGGVSDLHQQPYPVQVPSEQLELAREQAMGYYATLEVRPGKPTLAVGVWDELSGTESFVQTEVLVGEEKRARREREPSR